jgi:hypothetical protein
VKKKRSAEGWNLFSEAVQIVLSRWAVVRAAVDEQVRSAFLSGVETRQ